MNLLLPMRETSQLRQRLVFKFLLVSFGCTAVRILYLAFVSLMPRGRFIYGAVSWPRRSVFDVA